MRESVKGLGAAALLLLAAPLRAAAADAPDASRLTLPRISAPIRVDGDLTDAGWKEAARVETFYETNPGDNVAPNVRTVAWVGYDASFFYVAFRCDDPNPSQIRAPFVDRDNVFSDQDFAGMILDVKNDRRSALELFVNPRGIQDDGIVNDATGAEDFSPDYFWQSAGRIDAGGWQIEIAVPLSSLRYPETDPQTWAILLYRNRPRDYRYQLFHVKQPRGANCTLCHAGTLEEIRGLPRSQHLVAAPYAAGSYTDSAPGAPGYSGDGKTLRGKVGLDLKWAPDADTIVDATANPDFSQIESDAAQIAVNERFALFYPEKRPFFLEGVDLFATPIQAVYTRTITSPLWGARVTGKAGGSTALTALVTEDRGGGTVVIPGPVFSTDAPQDFKSIVALGRLRRDLGLSYAGLLGTARVIRGGGYNYVFGPDFQWRPSDADTVAGQYLYSVSREPDRPDLAEVWNGGRLSGSGWIASWIHSTRHWDWTLQHTDLSEAFRAETGFVPQVGYRDEKWDSGYTFYPSGFFSRLRPLFGGNYTADRDGSLVSRRWFPGIGFQGRASLRGELDFNVEAVQIDGTILRFQRLVGQFQVSPSRILTSVQGNFDYGRQPDVENVRVGTGGTIVLSATIRPTDHLTLDPSGSVRWIDETVGDREGRLFTAEVARVKATYVFSPRFFVRAIAQYIATQRDPSLWRDPVLRREGDFAGSLLFAYKLNWQSVLFVGYGDNRALDETGALARTDRQLFLKVSYAFQR
jgi:hypothetical protein